MILNGSRVLLLLLRLLNKEYQQKIFSWKKVFQKYSIDDSEEVLDRRLSADVRSWKDFLRNENLSFFHRQKTFMEGGPPYMG